MRNKWRPQRQISYGNKRLTDLTLLINIMMLEKKDRSFSINNSQQMKTRDAP